MYTNGVLADYLLFTHILKKPKNFFETCYDQ